MCLIMLKKPGLDLTKRLLRASFTNNNDGAGFMFAANNKLHIHKGFMRFKAFYKTYRKYERLNPKSTFVIHFRIAACGPVCPENTHPFSVNDNLAVVHNGVFSGLGSRQINDTFIFATTILTKFPKNFLEIDEIKNKIEEVCVLGASKLVFLDNEGKSTIMNENAGMWDKGIWYSNRGYDDRQNYAELDTWNYPSIIGTKKCTFCDTVLTSQSYNAIWAQRKTWYICKDCLNYFKDGMTIMCPKCYQSQILESDCKCGFCGTKFENYDIAEQLLGGELNEDTIIS